MFYQLTKREIKDIDFIFCTLEELEENICNEFNKLIKMKLNGQKLTENKILFTIDKDGQVKFDFTGCHLYWKIHSINVNKVLGGLFHNKAHFSNSKYNRYDFSKFPVVLANKQ